MNVLLYLFTDIEIYYCYKIASLNVKCKSNSREDRNNRHLQTYQGFIVVTLFYTFTDRRKAPGYRAASLQGNDICSFDSMEQTNEYIFTNIPGFYSGYAILYIHGHT